MNRRHFAVQLLLAVFVLAAANVVVQRMARNSNPRQLLRASAAAVPATHLFLGNSTMAAGIDTDAFAIAHPQSQALNLGLGSSSPVEHYLIYLQQQKHKSAAIYYGFIDTQMTDSLDGSWTALIGNRAMAYYVSRDVAERFYAADDPLRVLSMRLASRIPLLVERHTIWAKVERLRRFLGEIGMPKKETNQFGRAEDFALLEAAPEEFRDLCKQVVAERMPLAAPIAALLADARQKRSSITIVEMPLPTAHRRCYYEMPEWIAYRAYVQQLIHEAGGRYINAAVWIADDGFTDRLHLNTRGARDFSSRLAGDSVKASLSP